MATFKDKTERDCRLIAKESAPERKSLDFNKIKVGNATLKNDVILNTDYFKKSEKRIDRNRVEQAIERREIQSLREISNAFFDRSGIYSRLCRYMAFLYRYDWFVTPVVYNDKIKPEKVIEGWYKSAVVLENSRLKKTFGKIALKVIKDGCYYGYKINQKSATYLQELPVNYCRSRYEWNGKPAVEFNIKYFDETFSDVDYRIRVLKTFPKEFQKAYVSYKKGTLKQDFNGDDKGWFLLDPKCAVKFNLSNSDAPLFVPVIPALLDLEEAQEIDKKKMQQQIMKIIIQKMPIDKNGDLIFDVEEAQALHANAVAMLGGAIGVDVLTTFADVDVADLSDKGNVSSVDQLDKVERGVYNQAGVSQNQFNGESQIALEKSIANDEATMTDLLLQFEEFAESLLDPFNKNANKLMYKVQMLPTTIYNYKDLSKQYKEQTMLGFSKLLPQVALGQSQSEIIATAIFENDMLNLDEVFVAPQMSSTMNGNAGSGGDQTKSKQDKNLKGGSGEKGGRPELADDEKSDKTIKNKEAGG